MEGTDSSEKKQDRRKTMPHLFKKGQSGNPAGRPKGTISLKTFAQNYLKELTYEEKIEFMEGLPKEIIWKMAEGNPKQDTEVNGNLTISEVLDKLQTNGSETT